MPLLLVAAVQVLLQSQAPQATIRGSVTDEASGEPIAGALVTLPWEHRTVVTGPGGRYLLSGVPGGAQRLTVRFIGRAPRQMDALVPSQGEVEINIALRPIPLPLVPIESHGAVAVRGVGVEENLHASGEVTTLAAVRSDGRFSEPDALAVLGGGDVVADPELPSGIHLRGGASDQLAFFLDGIPVFSPYHSAGLFSAWNPDALAGLQLSASGPLLAQTHALSGALTAYTRSPGTRATTRGSFSTTQARITVDGPLGMEGGGYVVSLRSGFAGDIAPKSDRAYLNGSTADGMVKLEVPAFGGHFNLLGYEGKNGLDAAARSGIAMDAPGGSLRNSFTWRSRSVGLDWQRATAGTAVRLQGWYADEEAGAGWAAETGAFDVTGGRHDVGLAVSMERHLGPTTNLLGVRAEFSRTSYQIDSDTISRGSWVLEGRTPITTAFGQHTRPLSGVVELRLGGSLAAAAGGLYLSPIVQAEWKANAALSLSAGYDRAYQFAQSLRNAESIVGTIFPADLYVGAGTPGVPVARSDQGTLTADFRPQAGVHLGAQAYARNLTGLLLVAPLEGEPVATRGYIVGSGRVHGASLEAGFSSRHIGFLASYGYQHLRYEYGDSSYIPSHGAEHQLAAGLNVVPVPSLSVRVGVTGIFGRHATAVSGAVNSESCNLLDRGCEFSGSPNHTGQALGAVELPAYFRVDLGLRKEWALGIGGRSGTVALFGSLTNVLNHKNFLTYSREAATSKLTGIKLRPRAPLVVGLDWQF